VAAHSVAAATERRGSQHAGTEANVWINLKGLDSHGKRSSSGEQPLDNERDKFERGHLDVFDVDSDLILINTVKIQHDNTRDRPGWFLQEMRILRMDESATARSSPPAIAGCRWMAQTTTESSLSSRPRTRFVSAPDLSAPDKRLSC
jgi:PLAT/LH2 domain